MGKGEAKDAASTRAEVVSKVCERIAGGESVNAIFADKSAKLPDAATWWRWLSTDKDVREAYESALVHRGEKYAEEIVEIIDEPPPQVETQFGSHADPAWVQWQKNRAEARKWVASRMLPKRYGDRTTIAGDADNPLAIDVTDARGALLRGLAPKPTGSGEGGAG